ncbi:hypothetical protein BDN70DRAFT_871655 [Pholiota conissans]|uniref:Uncharacterized protein n=1 Tax=Pholiota conissans TaxID=109636 RepID=A0A9P5ZDP5_9AGAR|nr:hypothetical protein BDN70DRAFT_871655 [Pholiota conissans]
MQSMIYATREGSFGYVELSARQIFTSPPFNHIHKAGPNPRFSLVVEHDRPQYHVV